MFADLSNRACGTTFVSRSECSTTCGRLCRTSPSARHSARDARRDDGGRSCGRSANDGRSGRIRIRRSVVIFGRRDHRSARGRGRKRRKDTEVRKNSSTDAAVHNTGGSAYATSLDCRAIAPLQHRRSGQRPAGRYQHLRSGSRYLNAGICAHYITGRDRQHHRPESDQHAQSEKRIHTVKVALRWRARQSRFRRTYLPVVTSAPRSASKRRWSRSLLAIDHVPLPSAEAITVARHGFDGRCEEAELLPQ